MIHKHYKEYCKGIENRTGVNCFWVINNSTEVTNTLDMLRHARALDSFDFSTLYTNIPHSQLKTRMEELIRNAYNTRARCLPHGLRKRLCLLDFKTCS